MKKIIVAAVAVSCTAFAYGICRGALSKNMAGQPPVTRYLSPAEILKRRGYEMVGSNHARALAPSRPQAPSTHRAKKSETVFVGGPANAKRNAAISGRPNTANNAATINGTDADGGR